MLLGAGCSALSAVCSLWNIMVGAEGADLAARAPSHCASVHQLGHVPGRTCKQGCGQGAARAVGKPQGPGLGNPLPAPSCQGWQIYSSMQAAAIPAPWLLFADGAGPGRGLQHVGCSSSAVFPGDSGCRCPPRGLPSAWGDRQHLVTGTCRSAFLNDELCLSVPSINSAVPAH